MLSLCKTKYDVLQRSRFLLFLPAHTYLTLSQISALIQEMSIGHRNIVNKGNKPQKCNPKDT